MSNLAWSLAVVNRTGLPALPHDVLLHVYSWLDVPAAVALSMTCRSLRAFAVSRPAWLTLARTLATSRSLALPPEKQLSTVPADLSTDEMRAAVQHTVKLANNLDKLHPTLAPALALALPEPNTIVHASLLPGARFLLTVQHGGTFACWDLAVTEVATPTSQPPRFPRRRSMQTQTNSADGVDVEMGPEFDHRVNSESDVNDASRSFRHPRCVAAWETKAEYVEFAYDLVPGGVLVALMVAVQVGHDPPTLKRDMYVARINLPTSAAPTPPQPGWYPSPPIPFQATSNSTSPSSPFTGRHHGLAFIAHSPIRNPIFISTTFINASGHAGILGDIPDTMVVFVLLFDPHAPTWALSTPTLKHPIRCASVLVRCGFKCAPATRYTALGTPAHVVLYAESTTKSFARRIEVGSMRRQRIASIGPRTLPVECIDLGVRALGTPRARDFVGSPGTEGAPFFTTVRAMLRRNTPKWLCHEDQERPGSGRRTVAGRNRSDPLTICALGLSVDIENKRTDIFRGLVLGAHDIESDSEDEGEDDEDVEGGSVGPSTQLSPGSIMASLDDSYSLPTPTQSSLFEPEQTDDAEVAPAASSPSIPALPLRRPFRRACRVRYKRTIFPAHVNYAHELAGMGSFGRYAVWVEGDGVPEEMDWQKEPLRMMIAPLNWESGAEQYPGLGNGDPADVEAATRRAPELTGRVLNVPSTSQPMLNMASCLALEDAAGVLAVATIEGQVFLFGLVA